MIVNRRDFVCMAAAAAADTRGQTKSGIITTIDSHVHVWASDSGSQRSMGGTDWPIRPELASYEQRLALYRHELPFLNTEQRADVLYRTVQRVWPFGI